MSGNTKNTRKNMPATASVAQNATAINLLTLNCNDVVMWSTTKLRHRHRSLTLAAMMISKFHGPVKTEGAVAVACSDEAV